MMVFSGSARHSRRGPNRAALNQATDDLRAGLDIQAIHIDSYTIAALACQGKMSLARFICCMSQCFGKELSPTPCVIFVAIEKEGESYDFSIGR